MLHSKNSAKNPKDGYMYRPEWMDIDGAAETEIPKSQAKKLTRTIWNAKYENGLTWSKYNMSFGFGIFAACVDISNVRIWWPR